VKALPHRHERDTRLVVGILSALAAIEPHLPASRCLRCQRNDKRRYEGRKNYTLEHRRSPFPELSIGNGVYADAAWR
jgi:hypothetical protein